MGRGKGGCVARPTLFQHRKFLLLCRKLGDEAAALGYLEFIWAAGNESGDPHFPSEESLEATARWRGEDGKLAALLIGQFVDRLPDGTLEIHDFWDHCPDYVRKRLTRETERRSRGAERRRTADADRSVTGQSNHADRSVTGKRPHSQHPTPNTQEPPVAPLTRGANGNGSHGKKRRLTGVARENAALEARTPARPRALEELRGDVRAAAELRHVPAFLPAIEAAATLAELHRLADQVEATAEDRRLRPEFVSR